MASVHRKSTENKDCVRQWLHDSIVCLYCVLVINLETFQRKDHLSSDRDLQYCKDMIVMRLLYLSWEFLYGQHDIFILKLKNYLIYLSETYLIHVWAEI